MTEENRSILTRVKKLLALAAAGSGATPDEAATAAAKAADLLAAHRLAMGDVEGVSLEDGDAWKVVEEYMTTGSRPRNWVGILASCVARTSRCRVIYTWRNGAKGLAFIGRRDDATTALALMQYLVGRVKHLSAAYAMHNAAGRSGAYAFATGCVDRICQRLLARDRERQAESPQYGALVVQDSAAVDRYMAEHYANLRAHRGNRTQLRDGRAYQSGTEAGANVALGGGSLPGERRALA